MIFLIFLISLLLIFLIFLIFLLLIFLILLIFLLITPALGYYVNSPKRKVASTTTEWCKNGALLAT